MNTSQTDQLREMNEALLGSSVRQHELAEQAERAEALTRASEHRYRTLFELGPVAVYSCDVSGVIRDFNRRAAELWGRTPAIGDTDARFCGSFKMIRPDGTVLAHEQCPMAEVLSGAISQAQDAEISIERPDGTRVSVIVNIGPLKNDQGEITGAINCFYDITERKRAEEALRASGARFRFLAESMPQKIFTATGDGAVDYFNPQWMEYTGLTFEQIKGWGWKQFIHPLDLEETVRNWQHSIDTGEPFNQQHRFLRADGVYRWHLSRAFCMGEPNDNGAGPRTLWIGSNSDIDDVKRAERERQAMLVNEQAARMEANAANRAKDLFLATLSHELRTPLNAIVGWMTILRREGCQEADLKEGLDVIERSAMAQAKLIEDVLDVSRIISGKLRLEIRPCELAEVVRSGIDAVRSAAEAREIRLEVTLDPTASPAVCDAARIQQVVWNLVSNAVKFTPKGGTVGVTLTRRNSTTQIEVSDSGQGIDPELLPFVFDRFRQADGSTRRRFGGLGLGLSIVKHLVEMHGGTVEAHSPGAGRGSTFTIRLPIKAVRIDEELDDQGAAPASTARGPGAPDKDEWPGSGGAPVVRLDGLRILVVDDEADARRMLAKVLEDSGAIVTAAGSADEAMKALYESRPEVLVSDIGMPDRDGMDLIRQIRSKGHHPRDLPAIALSAFVQKDDQRRALLAGFQVHVAKPVDPCDLTAVIASLTGRTGTG